MKKKIIKYGLLILFSLGFLYQLIPIGDYSSGLLNVFGFLLFLFLLVILIITFLIIDIRKTKKVDTFFTMISVSTITLLLYFFTTGNYIFWKNKVYEYSLLNESKIIKLRLYDNNSFSLTLFGADYSDTYQGNYKIDNNVLYIERKDVKELSNNLITNEYKIIDNFKKELIPVEIEFQKLKLSEDK